MKQDTTQALENYKLDDSVPYLMIRVGGMTEIEVKERKDRGGAPFQPEPLAQPHGGRWLCAPPNRQP